MDQVPAPSGPHDEAALVRQRFNLGDFSALSDPLLPLLLLAEPGADWVVGGLYGYAETLWGWYAAGVRDRDGKHLSAEQREYLLTVWAQQMMGPPTNFARWQTVAAKLQRARSLKRLYWSDVLTTIEAVGEPLMPALLGVLRRLVALHPSRSTLDLRPLEQLERLCGMSPP